MEWTLAQLAQGALAAILVGFSKTGVSGLGILIVPLMAAVFPAKASVGILLPMLIVGDLFGVAYHRRHAQWPVLVRLLPWVLPGILGGFLTLRALSSAQLAPALGSMVLVFILLNALKERLGGRLESELPRKRWYSVVFGILTGFATMMGNMAGPIVSIYLISMGMHKRSFMGTAVWYYLIVNLIKVPFNVSLGLINLASLKIDMMAIPLIAVGAGIGILVFERLPQRTFRHIILILATVAAIRLMATAFQP